MSDAHTYEIEVFRAGTAASKGLTDADLAEVVAGYNPATSPAPLVKGHPSNDAPAFGVIEGVRQDGSRLFAKLGQVAADTVQEIRDGKWLNRSVAFWSKDHPSNPTPGKLALKHLGLLGAASPAIAGMERMKFSDDDALEATTEPGTAVVFEAAEATPTPIVTIKGTPPVTEETEFSAEDITALIAERDALKTKAEGFEAAAIAARKADDAAFCATMVTAGTLAPGAKDDLVAVFGALDAGVIEFSADRKESATAVLKKLLGGAKPIIQFGAVTDPKGDKPDVSTGAGVLAAAKALQASDAGKHLSFDAAVEAVTKEA